MDALDIEITVYDLKVLDEALQKYEKIRKDYPYAAVCIKVIQGSISS